MIDLYLSAPDEATLAAALPALRAPDAAGVEHWLTDGLFHALDAGFAIVLTPAEIAPDGAVTRPAVLAQGYHANLRLLDGAPDRDAILAAAAPYRVEPATPRRVFAGDAADLPVPETISDRQFAEALAGLGVIDRAEALAFVKRGDVPADLQTAIDAIADEDERFAVDMQVSGATLFERSHPSTLALAKALKWSPAQMDALWRRAAAL